MANVIKHKRGSGSDPAANNLVLGELAIRTDTGKLFTKMDSGAIAEIAGGGSDIAINTLSSSSGTGGGSATFNGSAFRFTLSAPPSVSAQQLLVSINGVIQKPVAGTGQPSEGFSVDGSDIILGDAPAAGSDFFILTFKSLGVSEPADNSVTSAKIVDGTIVNADINASAAIAGSKISPDFGGQDVTTTGNVSGSNLILSHTTPTIQLNDSNNNPDYVLQNNNGVFRIRDNTNSADRLVVNTDGHVDVAGNLDVGAGLDVTGNTTFANGNRTLNLILADSPTTGNVGCQFRAGANDFIGLAADGTGIGLVVDDSNNVGIGTINPDGDKLFVQLTNDNSNAFKVKGGSSQGRTNIAVQAGNASSGSITAFRLVNSSGTGIGSFHMDNSTDDINIFNSSQGGKIFFHTNESGSSLVKMTIADSGNVGIGTSSPDQKLYVQDTTQHSLIRVIAKNDAEAGIDFGDTDDLDIGRIRYNNNGNHMRFFTNAAERIRIDSNGDVLIGTNTAVVDTKLVVAGNINQFNPDTGTGVRTKSYVLGRSYTMSTSSTNILTFDNWGTSAFDITVFRRDNAAPAGAQVIKLYLAFHGSGTNITQASIAQENKVLRGNIHNVDFGISENNNTATLTVTGDDNGGETQDLTFYIMARGHNNGTIVVV